MMKIIVLLCLGLIGCATVPGDNKVLHRNTEESGTTVKTKTTANLNITPIDPKDIDNIIAIFSEAIQKNPNYAGAYYNRAAAYFYKKNYDKSWQDIHKAETLGIKVDLMFIALVDKLKKASGRER